VVGLAVFFLVVSLITKEHLLIIVSIVFLMGLLLKLSVVYEVASYWHQGIVWIMTAISTVLLTVVFYILITPYSVVYRVTRRHSIREYMRGPNDKSSYHTINRKYDREFFKNPW
jgi:membrane protein YdbS with pleckstrin-like domain